MSKQTQSEALNPMGFYRSAWFWGPPIFLVAACVVGSFGAHASAQELRKSGVWYEGKFTVEGEEIQKFRDTTHGSNNVCYLIRRTYGGQSPSNPEQKIVSLTCVSEP